MFSWPQFFRKASRLMKRQSRRRRDCFRRRLRPKLIASRTLNSGTKKKSVQKRLGFLRTGKHNPLCERAGPLSRKSY